MYVFMDGWLDVRMYVCLKEAYYMIKGIDNFVPYIS